MQYALVSSTCKTTRRNMTLAVECDVKQQINLNLTLAQETRRNSNSGDVHAPVEDHNMVSSLSHNIKSQTHSRVSECDGRPPVQVEPSAVNRMVTACAGVQKICQKWFTPRVDLFATHLNHKFIYLFGVLRHFHHCRGHITTGSWKGRGHHYI